MTRATSSAETWHRSIYSSVTAIVFAQDPSAPDPPRVFAVPVDGDVIAEYVPEVGDVVEAPAELRARAEEAGINPDLVLAGESPLSPGQSLVTDRHHDERLGDALLVHRRGGRRHAAGDRSPIAGPVHLSSLRCGSGVALMLIAGERVHEQRLETVGGEALRKRSSSSCSEESRDTSSARRFCPRMIRCGLEHRVEEEGQHDGDDERGDEAARRASPDLNAPVAKAARAEHGPSPERPKRRWWRLRPPVRPRTRLVAG